MQHIMNLNVDKVNTYLQEQNYQIEANKLLIKENNLSIYSLQDKIINPLLQYNSQVIQSKVDFSQMKSSDYFSHLKNTEQQIVEYINMLIQFDSFTPHEQQTKILQIRLFLMDQNSTEYQDLRTFYLASLNLFLEKKDNQKAFFGKFSQYLD